MTRPNRTAKTLKGQPATDLPGKTSRLDDGGQIWAEFISDGTGNDCRGSQRLAYRHD